MSGAWIELEFIVAGERVDAWSDALLAAGALSVQVEDADADGESERPIFGEPGEPPPAPGWRRSRLRVLLEGDPADPLAGVALLAQAASIAGEPVPERSERRAVAERDWIGETQAQFDELLEFVQRRRFERLGVFSYRLEPGTRSAELPGHRARPRGVRHQALPRTEGERSIG